MAQPIWGSTAGAFLDIAETFTASNTTVARILQDNAPAVPAANLLGGARVFDLVATNTDASNARSVVLYDGLVLTTQGTTPTGNLTVTAQNTISRATGSFITDGWKVGQTLMVFAPFGSSANGSEGVLGIVTAVAATTLTVNGTPLTNETFVAGTRIVKVAQRTQVSVAASSGNSTTAPNAQLIGSNDSTLDTLGIELGSAGVLIAAMVTTMSALPVVITISGKTALR